MTGVQMNSGKPLTPDCPEGITTFRAREDLRIQIVGQRLSTQSQYGQWEWSADIKTPIASISEFRDMRQGPLG